MHRLRVVVTGRVQGVGFRWGVARQAQSQGAAGWVRNREDGAVEAEFEGDRAALESLLDWCRSGPMLAEVTHVSERWEEGPAKFGGFHVRG